MLTPANAEGPFTLMSTAYTRSTSRLRISSDNGTCSCSIVLANASVVEPLIVIIALVTDIPLVMIRG